MGKTLNDINNLEDLQGTVWKLNDTFTSNYDDMVYTDLTCTNEGEQVLIGVYKYGDRIIPIKTGSNLTGTYGVIEFVNIGPRNASNRFVSIYWDGKRRILWNAEGWQNDYGTEPRYLIFNNWSSGKIFQTDYINFGKEGCDFLGVLKDNATFIGENANTIVKVNEDILNKVNGKKVRAVHYGDKTWEL